MDKIKRKTMLYKTGVEYGDYTMNFVQGCSHGCRYPCFAFLMARRFGKARSYEEWVKPKLVENTLDLLKIEIPRLKNKIKSVQLCFTTDPFMVGYPEVSQMCVDSIRMLNDAGIKCVVLTKGILPSNLDGLSKENEYGITLVSLDEGYRKRMEPGAAPYEDRLFALKSLYDKGLKTWVSIEPYPTPNLIKQNLSELLQRVSFVNEIIFGRTHYSKKVTEYKKHDEFYNECVIQVVSFCKEKKILCHIKTGTATSDEAISAYNGLGILKK